MSEQMSLDGILSNKAKAEVPAETAPLEAEKPISQKTAWRDKEQEAKGLVRNQETGQFSAKEPVKETKLEPVKEEPKIEPKVPVEELTAKERAAFAKAADETRKRQALERELAQIRSKPEPPKPFFDDPDGTINQLRAEIQQASTRTRLDTSEFIAKSRHPDFVEKYNVFNELIQETPYLLGQMMNHPDPGEFVYQTAKTHQSLKEAGGMDALRQKMEQEIEAKVRAKLEAELKDKAVALGKERAALPGSLSDASSKGVNRPTWGGPTSLDNILKT